MNATTLWKSRSEGPFPVTSNKESDEKNNKAGVAESKLEDTLIETYMNYCLAWMSVMLQIGDVLV